ncbi:hypothetical protein GCM10007164_27060 [Luteimonas padinae]|uniref:Uncharacterized protein n=1 Tax=Luteimonas padinae TaxID=1714359 RepID=A0ABV6SS77_9GAMM|nr:hypothetical protein [Luteimonas padinae]GHD75294.1 hypothetical protein GCM10007164_27060 [Luteimonas padinae]
MAVIDPAIRKAKPADTPQKLAEGTALREWAVQTAIPHGSRLPRFSLSWIRGAPVDVSPLPETPSWPTVCGCPPEPFEVTK